MIGLIKQALSESEGISCIMVYVMAKENTEACKTTIWTYSLPCSLVILELALLVVRGYSGFCGNPVSTGRVSRREV